MNDKPYSLLPDNRSVFERGLESAFNDLLADTASPYPQLLDGNKTAEHLLPHLAQERSVPEWNPNDPEHIKRQLVDRAWSVRRLSGTRAGIKLALDNLDYGSSVTPWFKMDTPQDPYYLEVLAWEKGNKPIDVEKAKRLIDHIEDTQSLRDTVDLNLVFSVDCYLGAAGAMAPSITITHLTMKAAVIPYELPHNLSVSGASRSVSVTHISARAIT